MDACSSNPCFLSQLYTHMCARAHIHTYTQIHMKYIHICFRRSVVHATQLLFNRARMFFLQPGFRQVRSNWDFKTCGCKLEGNRANVALRNMLLDSHIFKIGSFYIQTKISGFLEKLRQTAIQGLYYNRHVSKRQCWVSVSPLEEVGAPHFTLGPQLLALTTLAPTSPIYATSLFHMGI